MSTEPALPVQPAGPVTSQVTAGLKVPVPLTVAVNWTVEPMVTAGAEGVNVTEVMAFTGGV